LLRYHAVLTAGNNMAEEKLDGEGGLRMYALEHQAGFHARI
jgi:hypothetical protein